MATNARAREPMIEDSQPAMAKIALALAPPEAPVESAVTRAQLQARDLMAALDEIAGMMPEPERSRWPQANFVRSHLSVPMEFLATAVAAVERSEELRATKRLDPASARETLQLMEAFRVVVDRVDALAVGLRRTLNDRRAVLASQALQIYDIAKALARYSNDTANASLVSDMKRDLGRRGAPRRTRPADNESHNAPMSPPPLLP